MQTKFYKKIILKSVLGLASLLFINSNAQAQVGPQGLTISSVNYTATTATVYVKAVSLSNIIGFQGTVTWDKNSLQHVSTTIGSNIATLSGQFNANQTNGTLTYLISEPNVNAVNIATDTIMFSIKFNVINNPANTYKNNTISFANAPLILEVDTSEVGTGIPVQVLYPNLENHTGGSVAFARPPYLTYVAGTIIDTVTNRPIGCTYQWFESGNPVAGPNASIYPASPAGVYCLNVTYPNNVVVTCATGSGTVTPVKLSSFSGKSIENKNQLNWSTQTETNTKNFEIQKSENGKDFVTTGKVDATGNTTIQQNYSYNDAAVKSVLYYRLKINDNNGSYGYSNIIKVTNDSKTLISLYPNPAKNMVNITGEKIEQITITDLVGKTILQKAIGSVNNTTLNISNLSKGIYSISIKNAFGTQTSKLIVE